MSRETRSGAHRIDCDSGSPIERLLKILAKSKSVRCLPLRLHEHTRLGSVGDEAVTHSIIIPVLLCYIFPKDSKNRPDDRLTPRPPASLTPSYCFFLMSYTYIRYRHLHPYIYTRTYHMQSGNEPLQYRRIHRYLDELRQGQCDAP